MFKTQYNGRVRVNAPAGTPIQVIYEPYYTDDGVLEIRPSGKVNSYLEIQSHADSVDINVLLARYRNGETDVLNRVQGFFGDVSDMPKTYAEMLNLIISGERFFGSLSPEIREKFNNSFGQFISQYGTKEFEQKLKTEVDMNLVNEVMQNDKAGDSNES